MKLSLRQLIKFAPPIVRYIVLKKNAVSMVKGQKLDYPIWGEGTVHENIQQALEMLEHYHGMSGDAKRYVAIQMVRDYLYFGVTPKEFVLFDFLHKSFWQKSTFLPDQLKDKLSIQATGLEKFKRDLQDKYHFYELLSPFFKRKLLKLDSHTSFEDFDKFCKEQARIFIKPLDASYGKGASKFEYSKEQCRLLYEELTSNSAKGYVLESLILQDDLMAKFNSSSVNTVRLPTIVNDSGFHVLGAFMRTGRKGSIVDNGGSGGIISAIDTKKGIVVSDGVDEKGLRYSKHPDSGEPFRGFAVPQWQELLAIAENAHRHLKGHKYVAWDFAYTSTGWVLIEGNWGQFLSQFATGKGLKKEFVELMNN